MVCPPLEKYQFSDFNGLAERQDTHFAFSVKHHDIALPDFALPGGRINFVPPDFTPVAFTRFLEHPSTGVVEKKKIFMARARTNRVVDCNFMARARTNRVVDCPGPTNKKKALAAPGG